MFSAISDVGSARICASDAFANQGYAPGYFYNKKLRRDYPAREEVKAAYGASVSSPANVARIK